ncbi:MAG TPA: NAD(P)H-dependent oxidoreductase [Candidatus Levybacteria bacterium]|nr:NAD(P)H-dependent oxidoreductase [Candidatus Levybacteria bacterium]
MKFVGIAGSLRIESLNKKILLAGEKILKEIDPTIEYTELDLKTLALPVYDQDIQDAGMPENVMQFKTAIENADIIMIATPEYNHSIPGGLKNAIDWASRGKNSLGQKVVALMGATDGMGGTIRAQEHLRVALAALNAYVIPYPEVLIRQTDKKLDTQGNFTDEKGLSQIKKLLERTIKIASRLSSN